MNNHQIREISKIKQINNPPSCYPPPFRPGDNWDITKRPSSSSPADRQTQDRSFQSWGVSLLAVADTCGCQLFLPLGRTFTQRKSAEKWTLTKNPLF
jgi:hypothetical protein